MKTGNHIADIPDNDPYLNDPEYGIEKLTCDFCDERVIEEFINYDYDEGKKTGIKYCCDCEKSYLTWKKENHVN